MNELKPDNGWAGADKARIPIPRGKQRSVMLRSLSKAAKRFGRSEVPDVFVALIQHPGLFWPWLMFASRMMPNGKLPAADREKCILRTAWNCRCRYEWGQHVEIALSVGVEDETIRSLSIGSAACEGKDKVLLCACDELFKNQFLTDPTWQALQTYYDDKQRIELVMLIGHYQMLAGFINSAGLQLEPGMQQVLQALHQRLPDPAK